MKEKFHTSDIYKLAQEMKWSGLTFHQAYFQIFGRMPTR